MAQPLRPMNLGEILDRTLQIYRSRFLAFFSIAAIPALVLMGIELADNRWFHQTQNATNAQQWGESLRTYLLALLHYHFAAFMGLLIFPVFAKIASAAILDQATSARVELQFALSKWRSFLWIAFLKTAAQLLIPEALTFGVIILVAIIEYAAGAFDNKGNPILVALVLFSPILGGLALFAWVSCCLSLAVPIAALEPFTGLKALTRSWKLTRDGRLRILTAAFALSIFGAGLAIGFRLLLASITEILFFHGKSTEFFDRPLYLFVDDLLSALLAALTGPLYPIAITLFHYDQRIRREGFDIDWMMQRAGLVVPTPPQQEAQPADDPQHHLHQDAPPPAQPQLGVPQ